MLLAQYAISMRVAADEHWSSGRHHIPYMTILAVSRSLAAVLERGHIALLSCVDSKFAYSTMVIPRLSHSVGEGATRLRRNGSCQCNPSRRTSHPCSTAADLPRRLSEDIFDRQIVFINLVPVNNQIPRSE